jgi:hypothetical protein
MRTLIVASLLASTSLVRADDHKHTIADLKALVGQSAFKEAFLHLGDIAPAQRNADWIDIAAAASGGVLGTLSSEDGTTLAAIDEIDRDYPQLLKSAKYTKPRAELGLKGLAGCFAQTDGYWGSYGLDNCVTLGLRFVDNSNGDRALALAVAKVAVKSMNPFSAVPFFKRALGPKDLAPCKDEDLQRAVVSGLGLEPEKATDSKAIMLTCWDSIQPAIVKGFDENSAGSSYRKNTCDILKSKKLLSSLQEKQCARK